MDARELLEENEALNEQVKLLVKTERRLYGAQRVIEQQLRRLEALTSLATSAGRAGDPDLILELALHTLLDVLDVDQAVALVATPPSGSRLAAMTTQPGCEPAERHWNAGTIALPAVPRPMLLAPRTPSTSARVAALLDAVNEYFAPLPGGAAARGAPAIELVVPLRRKSGAPIGLLVLRKLELTVSYHESRISEADLPFVELVSSRVETDVDNVLLYRELEAFAADLERKVTDRTADLARTNEELARMLRRVRETQAQLIEASKSAAVLTLVAGLSHELNNPIGVILGYAQGLLAGAPDPAAQRQLAAIERQARRCSLLVKALLGFAENRPVALDSIPPALLLASVVAGLEPAAAERGVRLAIDPTRDELPSLLISAESMQRALTELVKNALDATPAGGTVVLEAHARAHNAVGGVELSVRDSGVGIPHAFLSRIFDPFFTTKPPGKGVGLGLSLARRSIEAHGGRLEVHSELGVGTRVRVWLPVAAAERRADEPQAAREGAR
jgi:signal transduction histidine kinase